MQARTSVGKWCRLEMGLLTALYVYLIFVPKMIFFNIFKRITNYTHKFNPDDMKSDFFNKKEDKKWMNDWTSSNRFLKAVMRTAEIQAAKEATQDGPAIDVELYDLVEKSTVKLFDFMQTNRPLVVNFGSCT